MQRNVTPGADVPRFSIFVHGREVKRKVIIRSGVCTYTHSKYMTAIGS